jgi:hypothetical protein
VRVHSRAAALTAAGAALLAAGCGGEKTVTVTKTVGTSPSGAPESAPTAQPATPESVPRRSAGGCANARLTDTVRAELLAARRKLDHTAKGPKPGQSYYGSCGDKIYALASFRNAQLGYQDQPEVFRKVGGGAWRDLGDTGGPPGACGRVPRRLMKVWRIRCQP